MLAFIRRALNSWVVLLLLGLLVVAFVVTGVHDPFGSGGVASGSLAKVGSKNITEPAFNQDFERFIRRIRAEQPSITNAEAARQGAVEQVLGQLVNSTALEEFGRKQGIAISQRAVDGQIASIPAFQSGGQFDEQTFRRMLAENRITERELREGLAGDAIRTQLIQNISIGAHVPDALVAPYAALLLETRTGSIGLVPANADVGTPTDAQLQQFYKANIKGYTVPERRGFRYALLTPEIAMAGVTISDADIKRYYDEHQELYGGIEKRDLLQTVVQSQDVAAKIAARVKAGEAFDKVAAELARATAADIAVGTVTEQRFADSTSRDVAKAAFAAPAKGVVGPVKSDFGWHVVQVKAVIPSPKRPLESVRGEINAKLRTERAQDALSDAVAAAQDDFDAGKSFGDVAKARKLTVAEVPPVTRAGTVPDGSYRLDAKLQPLLTHAFDSESGGQPTVQEVDKQTFALLEPGDAVAAAPVPLDKIRVAVTADWTRFERLRRAKATADAVVAEVAKGKPFAAALAERKLGAPQTASIRRVDMGRTVKMTPPVAALFTLTEHGVRSIAAPGGAGFLIVQLAKVTPGNPASEPGVLQATRAQIATATPEELSRQFVGAVRADVGVKTDPKEIARVRARLAGDTPAQ